MMKKLIYKLLVGFIFVSLLSCELNGISIVQAREVPTKSFVKVIKTITVKECAEIKDKPCFPGVFFSTGSGVVVHTLLLKRTLVLTADHVCSLTLPPEALSLIKEYTTKVSIEAFDGKVYGIKKIVNSNNQDSIDLCLLEVEGISLPGVKISTIRPSIGDSLYAMAAPGAVYHPPAVPIFHGIFSGPINKFVDLSTVPAMGGSSGAPILNKKMKLVGIIFAVSREFNHISLSMNLFQVTSFVEKAVKTLSIHKDATSN